MLAIFEADLSIENRGHEDILVNKPRVDISGGTGKGSSYKAEGSELKSLVEACNNIIFGHGSLGEGLKRSRSFCLYNLSEEKTSEFFFTVSTLTCS